MNKRGEGAIVAGFIALIVMVIVGSIGSYNILSENQYIGDTSTGLYYDLKKCDTGHIAKENLVSFKNLEEVRKSGYAPAKCSLQ
ncbi:hypothetical protein HYU15_03920 [Candidatus Woesearchaeota archaeon]|nr:hypothetical protein [Candidatus Woesearchaeota archaeon]